MSGIFSVNTRQKSRTPIGVLLFLTCYARSEPCHVRKAHGIRFATFAPQAARNSGYISHDLDGREKYLRKFLYFSFWERTKSGSHSPLGDRQARLSGVERANIRQRRNSGKVAPRTVGDAGPSNSSLPSCTLPQSML